MGVVCWAREGMKRAAGVPTGCARAVWGVCDLEEAATSRGRAVVDGLVCVFSLLAVRLEPEN